MYPRRSVHARAILGSDYDLVQTTKVLLVGAGGIGCELLKNIVMSGFEDITLLDLDTIDLSNLNRQFLFRKKDVKNSKAMVAANTASAFNPAVRIKPLHANIKEPQFDVTWFASFDIVLNALDNLDARRHVNRMCIAAGVPLVESGTAGYLGQVQPLIKDTTECFDCLAKPTPKSFPVCTIRSTPSQPIHCIVWAKSYLVPQLFGEDEDEGELDDAERQGENAEEIAKLREQAQAFRAVRTALRASGTDAADTARAAFRKVYDADIRNLLIMKDMWRSREQPVPLDIEAISSGSFVLRGVAIASTPNGSGPSNSTAAPTLRDQKTLSLQDNVDLFVSSCERLAARLRSGEETITFDKDDDDTLDFVTSASNLRSSAYNIPTKTRWEVKEMAGNIIPAIATTNAIIAGLIVLQALHVLRLSAARARDFSAGVADKGGLKNIVMQTKSMQTIGSSSVIAPNPACGVCRDLYVTLRCDPARVTLGELMRGVLGEDSMDPREVSIYEAQRVLYDPDFEDNLESTLESLGCTLGKFINIVDEDDELQTIAVALARLPEGHEGESLIVPEDMPMPGPKSRAKPPPPASPSPPVILPPTPARKRTREDDDGSGQPSAKKARLAMSNLHITPSKKSDAPKANGKSPSKADSFEEEGLIILEAKDVIELD